MGWFLKGTPVSSKANGSIEGSRQISERELDKRLPEKKSLSTGTASPLTWSSPSDRPRKSLPSPEEADRRGAGSSNSGVGTARGAGSLGRSGSNEMLNAGAMSSPSVGGSSHSSRQASLDRNGKDAWDRTPRPLPLPADAGAFSVISTGGTGGSTRSSPLNSDATRDNSSFAHAVPLPSVPQMSNVPHGHAGRFYEDERGGVDRDPDPSLGTGIGMLNLNPPESVGRELRKRDASLSSNATFGSMLHAQTAGKPRDIFASQGESLSPDQSTRHGEYVGQAGLGGGWHAAVSGSGDAGQIATSSRMPGQARRSAHQGGFGEHVLERGGHLKAFSGGGAAGMSPSTTGSSSSGAFRTVWKPAGSHGQNAYTPGVTTSHASLSGASGAGAAFSQRVSPQRARGVQEPAPSWRGRPGGGATPETSPGGSGQSCSIGTGVRGTQSCNSSPTGESASPKGAANFQLPPRSGVRSSPEASPPVISPAGSGGGHTQAAKGGSGSLAPISRPVPALTMTLPSRKGKQNVGSTPPPTAAVPQPLRGLQASGGDIHSRWSSPRQSSEGADAGDGPSSEQSQMRHLVPPQYSEAHPLPLPPPPSHAPPPSPGGGAFNNASSSGGLSSSSAEDLRNGHVSPPAAAAQHALPHGLLAHVGRSSSGGVGTSSPGPESPGSSSASPNRSARFSNWKKYEPPLGSGTFGTVFKGFNRDNGTLFAVKQVALSGSHFLQEESLRQLKHEIALMSQLQHPNIVRYIGTDMDDQHLYIFLEYMPGGSIHKLLHECGNFPEPLLRTYTRHIVSGLAYLHQKKTVHRDIKGANLLVDTNGQVKLADFGMAKHLKSADYTKSYEKGSSFWMAPEVLVQSEHGYDQAVDIWSLGCTVLEMATGKPPWWPLQGIQAMFKIANSQELPPMPDDLSVEGRDFVHHCLQRDPVRRPTAARLLEHPFIRNAAPDMESAAAQAPSPSVLALAAHVEHSRELLSPNPRGRQEVEALQYPYGYDMAPPSRTIGRYYGLPGETSASSHSMGTSSSMGLSIHGTPGSQQRSFVPPPPQAGQAPWATYGEGSMLTGPYASPSNARSSPHAHIGAPSTGDDWGPQYGTAPLPQSLPTVTGAYGHGHAAPISSSSNHYPSGSSHAGLSHAGKYVTVGGSHVGSFAEQWGDESTRYPNRHASPHRGPAAVRSPRSPGASPLVSPRRSSAIASNLEDGSRYDATISRGLGIGAEPTREGSALPSSERTYMRDTSFSGFLGPAGVIPARQMSSSPPHSPASQAHDRETSDGDSHDILGIALGRSSPNNAAAEAAPRLGLGEGDAKLLSLAKEMPSS